MATGYVRSRLFASAALAICSGVVAIGWHWQGGWIVAIAASLVYVDGLRRLRTGATRTVLWPLIIDVTATGTAVLVTDLPRIIVVAPLFYSVVSAVFALSRRWSLAITLYAATWSVAIIRFNPAIGGADLTSTQENLALAIAVVIFLSATFVMTTTAADAVQERQRLNADLLEKESRLQAVIESTPIVLYAVDNNGYFTLSEGPGLQALGLEPGQVVGLHFADVYGEVPAVLDMVNAALAADTETVHEVKVGDISFAVRHRPWIDPSGVRRGTVGVAIDVTVEARYRDELEQQIRSKDEFVASVSHELRTPLTVVYGLGEELRNNAAEFSATEITELHTLLAQQAGEVVAIVEDLLVAARADIDRLVVVPAAVDIGTQVNSVLQPLDLDIAVGALHEAVIAWCDGSRSRQILRNLVVNATRHGGEHIELSYGYRGDEVFVEVCDDGSGVPAGEETMIFSAYHSSKATAGNPASIGLGLTVARKLARLMDGDLTYERRDDWSVFTLTLPTAPATVVSR